MTHKGPKPWTPTAADLMTITRIVQNGGNLVDAAQALRITDRTLHRRRRELPDLDAVRTIENYLTLRELAPDLPFVPVLQGWTLDDYLAHVDVYAAFCVDLTVEPTVGVGSVCRRQDTAEIDAILSHLASRGLALHGFGVKTLGLRTYSRTLTSADSMAWSYRGRHEPGCRPGHKNEANCLTFARTWREGVLRGATFQQLAFGEA